MSDRRSPWVMLGIPYPSSRAAANRAFARRSRQLRRDPNASWSQEDLSWALGAITLAEDDPDATVDYYRIPADPGVFDHPNPHDLFVVEPRPMPRTTAPSDPTSLDPLCVDAVTSAVREYLAAIQPNPEFDPYQSATDGEEQHT